MPIRLETADFASGVCKPTGFFLYQQWKLHKQMRLQTGVEGASTDRLFPCLIVSIAVSRRPEFVVVNTAVPVMLFVLLTHLQFLVPEVPRPHVEAGSTSSHPRTLLPRGRHDAMRRAPHLARQIGDRLATSLTMLLATAVYISNINGLTPTVSYLTILDKCTHANFHGSRSVLDGVCRRLLPSMLPC